MVASELTDEQCRRAVRTVAHHAKDAAELVELLDMLGLAAAQGRAMADAGPVAEEISEPLRRIRKFANELAEMRKSEVARRARQRRQRSESR
jgi:hypothetical protein